MKKTYIKNLGLVCTGDIKNPISDAKAIYAEDGVIKYMGAEDKKYEDAADTVIDAQGYEVCPSLIDAQVHVPMMDFMQEFQAANVAFGFMAGGTGSVISVSNDVPGMPYNVQAAKAIAVASKQIWDSYAPRGAKVEAGTLTPVEGLTQADLDEMVAAGVKVLGSLGRGPVQDVAKAAELAAMAKKAGMVVTAHSGGAADANCATYTADDLAKINPDVVLNINGAPTPMTNADIDKVLATDAYVTMVPHGNLKVLLETAEKAIKNGKKDKLLIGSNTPKDGFTVLGTWVVVAALADKFQDIHPAEFICMASGNIADAYGLDHGKLAVGYKLDLDFLWKYGYDNDAMGTLKAGMVPASGNMILDGKMVMTRHKNVPALDPALPVLVTNK